MILVWVWRRIFFLFSGRGDPFYLFPPESNLFQFLSSMKKVDRNRAWSLSYFLLFFSSLSVYAENRTPSTGKDLYYSID